jgi:Fucose permease
MCYIYSNIFEANMATLLLIIIYAAFVSLGLPDSLFGVAWPVIHLEFKLDQSLAGVVTLIIGAGTIWTSFIAGKAIRKFGTGWVTAVSVLFTVCGLFCISLSPNIWLMILSAIILGIGAGAIDTALNDYVAKHYKPQHMSWLHCFWGIGVTASPLIMSKFLGDGNNWRGGYQTVALIQTVLLVVMFCSLPLWKKLEKTEHVSVDDATLEDEEKPNVKPIKIKGVWMAMLMLGFYCSLEFTCGTWGASFLINTKNIDAATAAKWVSFYYGGIMAGRGLTGFFAMKLSDKVLIRSGIIIAAVGAVMLIFPLGKEFTFIGLLLVGLGCAPIFPCTLHATASRFGAKYSADIVGYEMASAYCVGSLVQTSLGFIASRTTFTILPFAFLAFALLQLLLTEALNAKLKNQTA